MKNLQIKRNELKYFISDNDYQILVSRLINVLKPDKYSIPRKGYFIRSLYFDSYDDECLKEKLAGNMYRQKYRLRIYSTDTKIVKFEIKNKMNNQIFKETATISRDCAKQVISGNYDALLTYDNPVLNKIYSRFIKKKYGARVIVDYYRDAFVFDYFNIRITFDKNICSNCTDFDIFSNNTFAMPVILQSKQVLEVKYDGLLPDYIKNIMLLGTYERTAISKYVLSRRFHKRNLWEDQ